MILGKINKSLQRLDKKECISGWVEMEEKIPSSFHVCVDNGDGTGKWVEYEDVKSDEEFAGEEYSWAKDELALADIEINKILDEDTNASPPVSVWRMYRCALRAYATVSEEGVYSVLTDKPTHPLDSM